jgi:hypothetical protein
MDVLGKMLSPSVEFKCIGSGISLVIVLLLFLLFILSLAVKHYNWTCQPMTASHKRKQTFTH